MARTASQAAFQTVCRIVDEPTRRGTSLRRSSRRDPGSRKAPLSDSSGSARKKLQQQRPPKTDIPGACAAVDCADLHSRFSRPQMQTYNKAHPHASDSLVPKQFRLSNLLNRLARFCVL